MTSNSIKWSNNLTADTVSPGTALVIPPVNGIVYTVKAGDTAASLAVKYSANADQITAMNDAEISGLPAGEQIIIPNGQVAAPAARERLQRLCLWQRADLRLQRLRLWLLYLVRCQPDFRANQLG